MRETPVRFGGNGLTLPVKKNPPTSPISQEVKTPLFHGGNVSSILTSGIPAMVMLSACRWSMT